MLLIADILGILTYGMIAAMLGTILPELSKKFNLSPAQNGKIGMMQAIGEGFEILNQKKEFNFDLHQLAKIWEKGSVIRSWLIELTERALAEDPRLDELEAYVQDSGEGRWTVFEAIDLDVSAPVITASLQRRIRSRQEAPFSDKLVASLRNQFGGHAIKIKK